MKFHHLFDNKQSDSGAMRVAGILLPRPVELIKDLLLLILRYARTFIYYVNKEVVFYLTCFYDNPSSGNTVFGRILYQIIKGRMEADPVKISN